ncbi:MULTISPECIES: hypothetical protein [unclassified Caballeronia]|jgi:hypothetical protein|uniref:hypothetical protein n=1 Tax=unclassified Caballeronia TaxID=2646786 RepID=UPI002028B92E|nr:MULTISPECIES: hypothetical protein [unclassified Caballeronia]
MTVSDKRVDEVVVRPDEHAGWRVEVPDKDRPQGVFVTIVADSEGALKIAADMYPTAKIQVVDSPPET